LGLPVLDLLGHCQESLLNVGSVLRRGLEEGNVQLIGEFLEDPASVVVNISLMERADLCNTILDDLLVSQVGFVANKEFIDAFRGITVNLLEPLLDVGEGFCSVE